MTMKGTIVKIVLSACLITGMPLLLIVNAPNLAAQNNVWPCGNNPDVLVDDQNHPANDRIPAINNDLHGHVLLAESVVI
jgi:hypothetical protein